MNVKQFLEHFKDDLRHDRFDDHNDYLSWHGKFYDKTTPFHYSAKRSFFEEQNRLIDNRNYSLGEASEHLLEFAYLGLFTKEDDADFSRLIQKVSANLKAIDNETDMENALNYLYW